MEMSSLTILEARNPKSRYRLSPAPSAASGEEHFLASPSSGSSWQSSAFLGLQQRDSRPSSPRLGRACLPLSE